MTRALSLASVLLLTVALPHAQEKPAQRYTEQVDVERVLVDVRVLDDKGHAITGLAADDFSVKIGGRPVPIESTMWVGGASAAATAPAPVERASEDERPGRLIIFLFQKDFEPSRLTGLMRMLVESRNFLDELTPRDRI